MPVTVIAHTVKTLLTGTFASDGLFAIDTIVLDAVTRETHQRQGFPVDHPVEADELGSISDHVHLDPKVVTMDCTVTNTPVEDPPSHANGAVAIPRVVTPLSALADNPGEVLSNRLGAGDFTLGLRGQTALPPTVSLMKGFVPEFDRVRAVWEALEQLRAEKRLVSITTSLGIYERMLVTHLTAPRESRTDDSLLFTLTAREVQVVQSETVPAAQTELTAAAANLGKQATAPADAESTTRSRSIARRLF